MNLLHIASLFSFQIRSFLNGMIHIQKKYYTQQSPTFLPQPVHPQYY